LPAASRDCKIAITLKNLILSSPTPKRNNTYFLLEEKVPAGHLPRSDEVKAGDEVKDLGGV